MSERRPASRDEVLMFELGELAGDLVMFTVREDISRVSDAEYLHEKGYETGINDAGERLMAVLVKFMMS